METSIPKTSKATMVDFLAIMFHTEHQTHLWHLQTKKYAQHIALGEYYDGISDFTDDFIEKYMSSGPKVKAPQSVKFDDLKDTAQINAHLDLIRDYLDKIRKELESRSELVNMIDDAKALIHKTKYRLTLE